MLQKGDELDRFQLGLTVIMLFQENVVPLTALDKNDELQLGQPIAKNWFFLACVNGTQISNQL